MSEGFYKAFPRVSARLLQGGSAVLLKRLYVANEFEALRFLSDLCVGSSELGTVGLGVGLLVIQSLTRHLSLSLFSLSLSLSRSLLKTKYPNR